MWYVITYEVRIRGTCMCVYNTLWVGQYVNFLKFRVWHGYDMLTKFYTKTYIHVKYLKKINSDYSLLLCYYTSHNFLKIIHAIKIKNNVKISYKLYYKLYYIFIHMVKYQKKHH